MIDRTAQAFQILFKYFTNTYDTSGHVYNRCIVQPMDLNAIDRWYYPPQSEPADCNLGKKELNMASPNKVRCRFIHYVSKSMGPIHSASVTAPFSHTSWMTYPLREEPGGAKKRPSYQDEMYAWFADIDFEFPLLSGPFGGRLFYFFTINGNRCLDPSKPVVSRIFRIGYESKEQQYSVLDPWDIDPLRRIPIRPSPNIPPPLPSQSPLGPGDTVSQDPFCPEATVPRQAIQATVSPRAGRRLNLQTKTGVCFFRWPAIPPAKEVFVTGIYDIWGRKRIEKLIWNPENPSWELTLKVSIPEGQQFVDYSYIVDGVEKCNKTDPSQQYHTVGNRMLPDYNFITSIDISDPIFVPTEFTGMPGTSTQANVARFDYVLRVEFDSPSSNVKYSFATGKVSFYNINVGELKFSNISQKWEIRIAFDWNSQDEKFHYQLKQLEGNGTDWKTFIHSGLPHEDIKMDGRRGTVYKVRRNYIPLATAQRVQWPLRESIVPMGKYTFFWSAPTSPTRIRRVLVEGPFTQDPSIQISRELRELPDGTWSLTLELPARRMRYRYLVDGMYQTNWHENREMDTKNERWNFLEERDFVVEDYDEDELDITISRSTLQGLLEGSLGLDRLPSEVRELVSPSTSKPSSQSIGFELSERARRARGMS